MCFGKEPVSKLPGRVSWVYNTIIKKQTVNFRRCGSVVIALQGYPTNAATVGLILGRDRVKDRISVLPNQHLQTLIQRFNPFWLTLAAHIQPSVEKPRPTVSRKVNARPAPSLTISHCTNPNTVRFFFFFLSRTIPEWNSLPQFSKRLQHHSLWTPLSPNSRTSYKLHRPPFFFLSRYWSPFFPPPPKFSAFIPYEEPQWPLAWKHT